MKKIFKRNNYINKGIRKLLHSLLILFYLGSTILFLFLILDLFGDDLIRPESNLAEILNIDYLSLIKVFVISGSFFCLLSGFMTTTIAFFNKKKLNFTQRNYIYDRLIQTGYIISFVLAMLSTLTSAQFDILISTFSFIGIFSFIVPFDKIGSIFKRNKSEK